MTDQTGEAHAFHKRTRHLLRRPAALWIGGAILLFWIGVAAIGPFIAPHGQGDIISAQSFAFAPEASVLGTDYLGRDVLSRLLYGARMTLGIALLASLLTFACGVTLGFLAATLGGWLDQAISRLVDALLSFPSLVLALIVITGFGTSLPVVIATVALTESIRVYRVARALALEVLAKDFIDGARARGEGPFWIMFREILPNVTGPLLGEFGLRYVYVILTVSALSFLGLGVQPPAADWGVMVKENIQGLYEGSPAVLLPAGAIASVTISINLIVDWFLSRSDDRVPGEMRR
jgi:peptide/nickel transport system permease protein